MLKIGNVLILKTKPNKWLWNFVAAWKLFADIVACLISKINKSSSFTKDDHGNSRPEFLGWLHQRRTSSRALLSYVQTTPNFEYLWRVKRLETSSRVSWFGLTPFYAANRAMRWANMYTNWNIIGPSTELAAAVLWNEPLRGRRKNKNSFLKAYNYQCGETD